MLLLALASAGWAEEVYVRNRPFRGKVAGAGPKLSVDAVGLAAALDKEVRIEEGVLVLLPPGGGQDPASADVSGVTAISLEGKAVPVRQGMVVLAEVADAWGLRLVGSKELGTVDLHVPTARRPDPPPPPAPAVPAEAPSTEDVQAGAKSGTTVPERTAAAPAAPSARPTSKPYLLVVYGTNWCPFVALQIRDLNALAPKYKGKLDVLVIDVEHPKGALAEEFMQAFPGGGVPQSYLLDMERQDVIGGWNGYVPKAQLDADFRRLLK